MTKNHDTRTSPAITRRAALQSTAALGALAVPVGAALAATGPTADLEADPHLAWWRERAELTRRADAIPEHPDRDAPEKAELSAEKWDIERLICRTKTRSPLGILIVAMTSLEIAEIHVFAPDPEPEWAEDELIGGLNLARYIIDTAPPELRALVEEA